MTETAQAVPERGHLFRRYALLINALVGTLLIASAALSLSFSYRASRDHLIALQFEQAQGAAARIEQYIADIEQQLGWTALAGMNAGRDPLELRRIDYLKLLRQVPAITEAAWIDADGREQLRVSRLTMDAQGQALDRAAEPVFIEPMAGRTWRSPVSFRKQTEPYMTIARRAAPLRSGGVTVVEVNLKFVWDVITRIHPGEAGMAYAVDQTGALIAHPDISLVLKQTSLAGLPQVAASLRPAAALAAPSRGERGVVVEQAHDLAGQPVLSAWARLEPLDWRVFVESPRSQALAPVYASLQQLGLLLALGMVISIAASAWLARTLVRPIRALQDGAARVAAGDLDHRITVSARGELQALAGEFNRMAGELQASYAGLEGKVAARTAELADALAQQTATAEVLQVISRSVADTQPVFDKIVDSCRQLFASEDIFIQRLDERRENLLLAAYHGKHGERMQHLYPLALTPGMPALQAMQGRRVVHYPDVLNGPDVPDVLRRNVAHVVGATGSMMTAPLLLEHGGIGTISVWRMPPQPFSEKEQQLLQTFADQAVIAIQNARLFHETQEALAQQTAIAELVKAMSRTSFQLEALLHALIENATQLCKADEGFVYLREGEDYRMRVNHGAPSGRAALQPLRADMGSLVGRTALLGRPVAIDDVLADPAYALKEAQQRLGYRSMLGVPLLRDGEPIGVISLWRHEVRPFGQPDQRLVTTFADQAVIAIENARLFEQLQARTHQLEVAGRHKSEFLANMSHELRTPLNAIIGFSEVLVEQMFGPLNDKQMEYLRDIHSSGQHLLTLINDVLDLSKIEAGRMELDAGRVELAVLLESALHLVRERAERHGLALSLTLDSGLQTWVLDERKIKQVLLNLLSNAIKFTPAGGRVEIKVRRPDADRLEIAVIDSGTGIAAQDQAKVFEEFSQASGSFLRKAEGTGLGLALARRFVELHGGRLSLQSAPGQGSTFTFTLPALVLALEPA